MPDQPSPVRPTAPPPGRQDTARQRILETALRLFYAEGVRATGIDRIIAESGVAKMSFYRHFPSKSDLVCAFLEERHRRWMAWFEDSLARHGKRRRRKLPAVAEALREWFSSPEFRGCAFINITAEFPDSKARENLIAAAHKAELRERLAQLAAADGLSDPARIGRLALTIVDGAIVQAQITGEPSVADDARQLLADLARNYDRAKAGPNA